MPADDTAGDGTTPRWWIYGLDAEGRVGPLSCMAVEPRPENARDCQGDRFTPWYSLDYHAHLVDLGNEVIVVWSIHDYGTLSQVHERFMQAKRKPGYGLVMREVVQAPPWTFVDEAA